jgi:hypothetical protein
MTLFLGGGETMSGPDSAKIHFQSAAGHHDNNLLVRYPR